MNTVPPRRPSGAASTACRLAGEITRRVAAGHDVVALGGGCFANRWLAERLPPLLERAGLRVLTAWDVLPPGDGGLSLGQAWVAALALERGDAERR